METTTENIVDQVVVKIEPLNFLKKLESLMKVLQGFQEKEGDVSLVENAKKLFQSFILPRIEKLIFSDLLGDQKKQEIFLQKYIEGEKLKVSYDENKKSDFFDYWVDINFWFTTKNGQHFTIKGITVSQRRLSNLRLKDFRIKLQMEERTQIGYIEKCTQFTSVISLNKEHIDLPDNSL